MTTDEIARGSTTSLVAALGARLGPHARLGYVCERRVGMYRVHEAGEPRPDGTQRCVRCGALLLDGLLSDRRAWGFPVGRRLVEGPTCTYLITSDRQLAGDEAPCQ